MGIKDNIKEIRAGIETLLSRPNPRRTRITGLYVIAVIAMLGSLKSCNRTGDILERYEPAQVQNVMGQKTPEIFYQIDGHRCFLEIDGESVDHYKFGTWTFE